MAQGHSLASLTATFPLLTNTPLPIAVTDVGANEALIRAATCMRVRVLRPPLGAIDDTHVQLFTVSGVWCVVTGGASWC